MGVCSVFDYKQNNGMWNGEMETQYLFYLYIDVRAKL